MTNLVKFESVDELKQLCVTISKSGLFKGETPEQAFTKIMYGQELGLPPMAARASIHVIQGKPTLSSNAMASALDRHPDYDYEVTVLDYEKCTIVIYKRRGDEWLKRGSFTFTMEDAKRAKLLKPDSGWTKYPKAMLFARAISQAIRVLAPGCFSQPVYTPEELGVVDALPVDNYSTLNVKEEVVNNKQKLPKLPFSTIDGALEWAANLLDVDLDTAQAIMDSVEPTEKGTKSYPFYFAVLDYKESNDALDIPEGEVVE